MNSIKHPVLGIRKADIVYIELTNKAATTVKEVIVGKCTKVNKHNITITFSAGKGFIVIYTVPFGSPMVRILKALRKSSIIFDSNSPVGRAPQ